jgi:hypothetical protein
MNMDDTNDPIDAYLDDIAQSMSEYLYTRRLLLTAEVKLEALIKEDLAEVLTDSNGNFTYRITNKGAATFIEKTGHAPSTQDITFLQFAGINS